MTQFSRSFDQPFARQFAKTYLSDEPESVVIAPSAVNGSITWQDIGYGMLSFTITDNDRGWDNETVSASAADFENGVQLRSAMFASGPIILGQPLVAGNGPLMVGDTINITPPLWAHDVENGNATLSYGGTAGAIDVSDPTAPTYTLLPGDAGVFDLFAVVTDGAGTRRSTSNQLSVAVIGGNYVEPNYVSEGYAA